MMLNGRYRLRRLLDPLRKLVFLVLLTACGTLDLGIQEPDTIPGSSTTADEFAVADQTPTRRPVEHPSSAVPPGAMEAFGWYGQIKKATGTGENYDFLKLWHLGIWPKFGKGVGITGGNPAVTAEIERLRDLDVSATFWGRFACGVADYGACQLRVTRIAANDGGLSYDPDPIEGWEGQVGRLPGQPVSENPMLYFVLDGEVPVLYGLAGAGPAVQTKLEELSSSDTVVRLWGELRSRAQPVTGTLIVAERLEVLGSSSSS